MDIARIGLAALIAVSALGMATAGPLRPTEPARGPDRVRRVKPNPQPMATVDAERAARLAEGRRKFFENRPAEDEPRTPGDFGGYDYRRDSGTMKPGAMFKF